MNPNDYVTLLTQISIHSSIVMEVIEKYNVVDLLVQILTFHS